MKQVLEPPFNLESLRHFIDAGGRPKFLFFWSHTSSTSAVGKECLSQWFPAPFIVAGTSYPTAEHFMMAEKARLFGDDATLQKILAARSPGEAKALGRGVVGFSEEVWASRRFEIVVRASVEKFHQNPELGQFLKQTQARVLVEASPQDRVWGIGLEEANDAARIPHRWRGQNLLGFALMTARHPILAVASKIAASR